MFIRTIINSDGHTIIYFSSISLSHGFNLTFGCTTQFNIVPHLSKKIPYSSKSFIPNLVNFHCHLSRLGSRLVDFPICLVDEKFFLVDLASRLVDLTPHGPSGLLII